MRKLFMCLVFVFFAGCGTIDDSEKSETVETDSDDIKGEETDDVGLAESTDDGTEGEAANTDGEGDEDTASSSSHDTEALPDFSDMTRSEIETFARSIPASESGCGDDEGDACNLSFLDDPICSKDGFIVEPTGWCDEGGEATRIFCSPNAKECARESEVRCAEDDDGHALLMLTLAVCGYENDAPVCQLTEEELMMDCQELVGRRYCEYGENWGEDAREDAVYEVVAAGCSVPDSTDEEDLNWEQGCVPTQSTWVADCAYGEYCNGDSEPIQLASGRGPKFWVAESAQCEAFPCDESEWSALGGCFIE